LELKRLEFLFERTGAEEPMYVFKHALTQDVAYESLLTTRRQVLHASAGHALETLYPEGLTERYEELAHHFGLGAVWAKAFAYLAKSGDKARQAFANQEAIAFYTQAIEVSGRVIPALDEAQLLPLYEGRGLVWILLTKIDEAIADFQMMLQMARACSNRHKEGESLCHLEHAHLSKHSEYHMSFVEQYAQEALRLSQQIGDQHIRGLSLGWLGSLEQVRGNLPEGARKLEESVQISRREGYKDSLAQNLVWVSAHAYWQGNFQRALHFGQDGLTVSRDIHDGLAELRILAFLCLAYWGTGNYAQTLTVLHEGMTKAQERDNTFIIGKLTNTLGWFHREFDAVSRAVEYDQESIELGRASRISNVEVSALINLGLDYLALGQHDRALSYLEPTFERVQREAFGLHRWRWTIRLLIGLAELSYTTGNYDQALRYVDEGLKEAQRTSSQKYIALGWALRGKLIAKLGDTEAAETELQRAFSLADQLQSPSLIYPIAYDLGQWNESTGKEREAAALYGKAKATIEQMTTAVEDEVLRSTFLQSALVQEIHEHATRLGG
jgi:tetratricopeptide (TPR) repeat protein